jgi:DNA-binding transcriptional LysR family regulator
VDSDFDPRHLRVWLELQRRGSMRAAADATGYSTSAVSAQLASLERTAGTALLERDGRGVQLTPAGRRLTEHARTILAALDAARADLGADGPAGGTLRVAAFASALGGPCLAAVRGLRETHPGLRIELQEREPEEALALVESGAVDLAFVYDYALVPRGQQPGVDTRLLSETPMLLALPEGRAPDLAPLAGESWIVNSRGADDEELLRRVAARAGFVPDVRHRADALDLVCDLVAAGLGVALVPGVARPAAGVTLVPVPAIAGTRRLTVAVRPGHARRPPVALMTERVTQLTAAG